MREYVIAVVVDDNFGESIVALAHEMYVWMVDSPANKKWASVVWAEGDLDESDPLRSGLTTYKRLEGESLPAELLRVAEMVEDHHGEYIHDPPWTGLLVVGGELAEREFDALRSVCGLKNIERTARGWLLTGRVRESSS